MATFPDRPDSVGTEDISPYTHTLTHTHTMFLIVWESVYVVYVNVHACVYISVWENVYVNVSICESVYVCVCV